MMNCPFLQTFRPAKFLRVLVSVSFFLLLLIPLIGVSPTVFAADISETTTSGSDDGASTCSNPDSTDPNCYTNAVTSDDVDCDNGNGVKTELGICVPKDPAGFAQTYYRVGLGAIGGLSLLFIIFGGYLMQTSEGRPERLNNGRQFIFYAVFGLLLAIFGYVFVEVVAVDILHIPGFSH